MMATEITTEMRRIIEENTIGLVATVTPDGFPAVSPKGTTVVLDATHVAFSDLRSPGTIRNILNRPQVELNFLDIFRRKACRLRGTAVYRKRGEAQFAELIPHFKTWDYLVQRMRGIVVVEVATAELILSPAYDAGGSEEALRQHWLAYYTGLHASAKG